MIHEISGWPMFKWDQARLANFLADVRYRQGHLLGRMQGLGLQLCREATLTTLTQDVLNTSEMEGETLDQQQVRFSIARRLGMNVGATSQIDQNIEDIVEVLWDATGNYATTLSTERILAWHSALSAVSRSGMRSITVGGWRTTSSGSLRASGLAGHKEAPSAERLNTEMTKFIQWFNAPTKTDLVIQSAIAHFWFVTIHPFENGNGIVAHALADMTLARSENSAQRFYSLSTQIQHERKAYSEILERCQNGSLDITVWIEWYLDCLSHAITASEKTLEAVLSKVRFWEAHLGQPFNERQRTIINQLLNGFAGKLTSSYWAQLTKCSQDTALRDINDLLKYQMLIKDEAGGRSTSYRLRLPK